MPRPALGATTISGFPASRDGLRLALERERLDGIWNCSGGVERRGMLWLPRESEGRREHAMEEGRHLPKNPGECRYRIRPAASKLSSTREPRQNAPAVWPGRFFMSAYRDKRRRRRDELSWRGIPVPRRRFVVQVTLDAVAMPAWAVDRAVRGLTRSASRIWLRPADARILARTDREAGGEPTLIEAELRYCGICQRPLLGEDAAARRRLLETSRTANQRPCGSECIEAQQDRRWATRRAA